MKNSSLSLADLSLKNVNRYKLLKNAKNKADTKNLERLRLPHGSSFFWRRGRSNYKSP